MLLTHSSPVIYDAKKKSLTRTYPTNVMGDIIPINENPMTHREREEPWNFCVGDYVKPGWIPSKVSYLPIGLIVAIYNEVNMLVVVVLWSGDHDVRDISGYLIR